MWTRLKRFLRPKSVPVKCGLAMLLGLVLLPGCAHGVVVLAPDPCKAMTDEQLLELGNQIWVEVFPGVIEIVEDYEQHCCEDDALAGRDTSHCMEQ